MYIRKYELRFVLVFIAFISFLSFFVIKLILIQVFNSDHLAGLADKQHNYLIELEPIRGTIYDRKMRPLALNVPVYSLYANPRAMTEANKSKVVEQVSGMIGEEKSQLRDKLSRKKYFVWLKRKLSLAQVDKIKALKIPGLDFVKETKRFYPNQELASHILGFADVDNNGLEGIELYYNQMLKGKSGWRQILRDAKQKELMIEREHIPPQHGLHLILTLDETIQFIAERALDKAYVKYKAKNATIIVMDVKTGEILALANRPTYNLNNVAQSKDFERTNRAISLIYEPGSVFKIVTAAAALEEGQYTEKNILFCENGKYKVANHILHDHVPHGNLSFREVFEKSSNICTAKIAQKLGPDKIYKYAQRFHFGQLTDIDLAGEIAGTLKHPSKWSKVSISAIPMGHEVTTTPLQLVAAVASVANAGLYMRPFMVKYIKDEFGQVLKSYELQLVDRVISEDTARRVTDILVGVVERGTGRSAKIKDMLVAGKTGTAQKVIDGQYSHNKFYATFMGFAPADHPRLACVVVLDEPRPQYFGGTVAAPVFKEVIENALKYMENTRSQDIVFH